MPADAYVAWWNYFTEYRRQSELRKDQAEHDQTMDAVRRALKP